MSFSVLFSHKYLTRQLGGHFPFPSASPFAIRNSQFAIRDATSHKDFLSCCSCCCLLLCTPVISSSSLSSFSSFLLLFLIIIVANSQFTWAFSWTFFSEPSPSRQTKERKKISSKFASMYNPLLFVQPTESHCYGHSQEQLVLCEPEVQFQLTCARAVSSVLT